MQMTKIITKKIKMLAIVACILSPLHCLAASWIEISNGYTQEQLKVDSKFQPELGSMVGLTAYDGKCANVSKKSQQQYMQALQQQLIKLGNAKKSQTLNSVKQDLAILEADIALTIEKDRLDNQYFLPYHDVAGTIFQGLSALLDQQMPKSRQQQAVVRLQCYTGINGLTPLTKQAQLAFEAALKNNTLLGPAKAKIEQSLLRTNTFVTGLNKLFNERGLDQATEPLALLEQQLNEYDAWVKNVVLPVSRVDPMLPAPVYALNLKRRGIDIAPTLLIARAKAAYMETKASMKALAPLVAKQKQLPSDDYRDVINALKKEYLSEQIIEDHYRTINTAIEKKISEHKIVNLPKRGMIMRLASNAEAAASPAPHMLPPPFINNQGEQGQFVLTTGNPTLTGDAAYDDFNFKAVAYTLSAHEGRPGHELQFSVMLEQGVSLARVYYAFNSVNVEGWALYAEAEMLPYHPLEGQLLALQHRLLRNARAMLDPMLNLGLTSKDKAYELLRNEVVLSVAAATQEVDRYTLRSPGQAGSYFYGYSRLLEIRAQAELELGEAFDRLAFNNFILSQGLIPPNLMAKAVEEQFIAKYK